MPEIYKKISERQVTSHAMMMAAVTMVKGGETIRTVAKHYEISNSTLARASICKDILVV